MKGSAIFTGIFLLLGLSFRLPAQQHESEDIITDNARLETGVSDHTGTARRLAAIQKDVPLDYNEYVERYIEVYTREKRKLSERCLGRSEYYFPLIEEIFASEGVPDELKYLSIVESALYPRAVSRVGATGTWQFMYSTAREYGLKMDAYIDERKDLLRSSQAAARYLKKMNDKFGGWLYAIASYNCGPGNVSKAIRRSGGSSDFWDIYPYLPRETRGYVPAFIASVYFMHYAEDYELEPAYDDYLLVDYGKVVSSEKLLISELCQALEIDKDQFKDANPILSGLVIPSGLNIRIPAEKVSLYNEQEDTLYAISASKIKNMARTTEFLAGQMDRVVPADTNLRAVIYTVKEGDNIGYISSWYDVPVNSLRAWNGLRSSKIIQGQEMIIYVHKSEVGRYARMEYLSRRIKNILSADPVQRQLYSAKRDPGYIYHEVKNGESLWSISQQYPDTSIELIRELNNLPDNTIKPGMFLKVSSRT